jgi:hypothetical protein
MDGFSTVKRAGVQLTSDFTANVNAQLTVGSVESTIVVDAKPPLVDVQSVGQAKVFTRESMDQLPTDRTPNAVLFTIPGTQAGSFGLFSFRGSADSMTLVDGMRMTFLVGAGPGSTSAPTNSACFRSSASRPTSIPPNSVSRMRINLVLREAGRQFHGTVFASYAGRVAVGQYRRRAAPGVTVQRRHRNSGISTRVSVVRFDAIRSGTLTYQNIGQDTVQTGRSTTRTRCRTDTLPIRSARRLPGSQQ